MSAIIQENIGRWFENNVDLDNRLIFMGSLDKDSDGQESGTDNFMFEMFIKAMHILETKNTKPITIIMNNPGGEWYNGMAIYDSIKDSKSKCTIKVYGSAMSMGSIILQAADHRIMMPNSRMMIHYGFDGIFGHPKIMEKWADESKKNNYLMENIYLDKMLIKDSIKGIPYMNKTLGNILNNIKKGDYQSQESIKLNFSRKKDKRKEEYRKILKELLNFDTILTPEESISLGFADEIQLPTKNNH